MQIRPEQMQALDATMRSRFLDRLTTLASGLAVGRPGRDVRASCQGLVEGAHLYRLTSEFEVAAYVLCGFVVGMDFDVQTDLPYCQILEDEETSSLVKAAQLRLQLESLIKPMIEQEFQS